VGPRDRRLPAGELPARMLIVTPGAEQSLRCGATTCWCQRKASTTNHLRHAIWLGLGCSLLAGFGMAASAGRSIIHMVLFAGTLSIALYIVTDMEYPRLGLIRIEGFDRFLADAYAQMR
jgi:hypothetical protein